MRTRASGYVVKTLLLIARFIDLSTHGRLWPVELNFDGMWLMLSMASNVTFLKSDHNSSIVHDAILSAVRELLKSLICSLILSKPPLWYRKILRRGHLFLCGTTLTFATTISWSLTSAFTWMSWTNDAFVLEHKSKMLSSPVGLSTSCWRLLSVAIYNMSLLSAG